MPNPPYPSPPAASSKKVRPWVWALVSLGLLLAFTMAAMLFLLYTVDWSKWENKLKGATALKSFDWWKDLQEAKNLKSKGRFNEALTLYKQAIKKNHAYAAAHKEMITLAVVNDSLPDLESFYAGLIRDHPQEKSLQYYLAQIYFDSGKYPEALNVFQHLEESGNPTATSKKSVGNFTDPVHIQLNQAVIYAKMEKWKEAAEKCETAKKTPEAWKAHYVLGEIYAYRGDYEKALDEYRRALPNYSWLMNPYNRIGELGLALGKTKEAEEAYLKAVEKDPYNIKALVGLARLALKEEKYEKALNYLGSLGQEELETSAYHHLYGKAYLGLGRYPLAERHFSYALSYNPDDGDAARGLGDSLAAQEKGEAAKKAYLKAIALNPYQRESYLGLQKVYKSQGEAQKAKKAEQMLARLPGAESLKWEPEKTSPVVVRELELYGIFGGS